MSVKKSSADMAYKDKIKWSMHGGLGHFQSRDESKYGLMNEFVEKARKEEWDYIDSHLNELMDVPVFQLADMCIDLYRIKDSNLRDLAGTISSKMDQKYVIGEIREKLAEEIEWALKDENEAVRFRAATAAVNFNIRGGYEKNIKEILESMEDEELKPIAGKYLDTYKLKNNSTK